MKTGGHGGGFIQKSLERHLLPRGFEGVPQVTGEEATLKRLPEITMRV
jgi:hypothetical protein